MASPPKSRPPYKAEANIDALAPHLCVLPPLERPALDRFWAVFLGVSVARIRKVIQSRHIPHHRIGANYLVYPQAILDAFPLINPEPKPSSRTAGKPKRK